MSNNNPERDRTESLPTPEPTQPHRAPERTEALERTEAPERHEAVPAPEPAAAFPAAERIETMPPAVAPSAGTRPSPTVTAAPPSPSPSPGSGPEPERVRGPYLAPVILGLVCLAIAGLALAQEIGNWTIDWGNVGPLGIVAAGAVLVILGALGLVASRRRR